MSTQAAESRTAPRVGETIIKGRLVQSRRPTASGGYWETLIILPAPDAYSSPSTVAVLSKNRLGEKDEEVSVHVRVGGYKRSYKTTDPETGEIKNVQTADNKFFSVDN